MEERNNMLDCKIIIVMLLMAIDLTFLYAMDYRLIVLNLLGISILFIKPIKEKKRKCDDRTADKIGLMRAYFGAIVITVLFCTGIVTGMYAGENKTYDLSSEFYLLNDTYYEIINNATNLSGLNININGTNLFISTSTGFVPDSFNIIVYGWKNIQDIQTSTSISGGCLTTWQCVNGKAERVNKYCGALQKNKPNCTIETKTTSIVTQNVTQDVTQDVTQPNKNETIIKPSIIENKSNWKTWVIILGILFIGGLILYGMFKNK